MHTTFIFLYLCLSSHCDDCVQKSIPADECVYHFSSVIINPCRMKVAPSKLKIQILHTHIVHVGDKCFLCDGGSDLCTDSHAHCCCIMRIGYSMCSLELISTEF